MIPTMARKRKAAGSRRKWEKIQASSSCMMIFVLSGAAAQRKEASIRLGKESMTMAVAKMAKSKGRKHSRLRIHNQICGKRPHQNKSVHNP